MPTMTLPRRHRSPTRQRLGWLFGFILDLDFNAGRWATDAERIADLTRHTRILHKRCVQLTEDQPDPDAHFDCHRKWCGLLNRPDFEALMADLGLYANSNPTMGALGMPTPAGPWYAPGPAICFDGNEGEDHELFAYVTPYPPRHRQLGPRDWRRVFRAVVHQYR